jgi:hypothetical protein
VTGPVIVGNSLRDGRQDVTPMAMLGCGRHLQKLRRTRLFIPNLPG